MALYTQGAHACSTGVRPSVAYRVWLVVAAVTTSALLPQATDAGQAPMFSGHGPVFGMTTPTNAEGGWAVDVGLMGRQGAADTGAMARTMFSYGLTEDVQISWSIPLVFSSAAFAPARMTGMMPGSADVEVIGAWRFHRQGTGIGRRVESTAYAGVIVPGPQRPAGLAGILKRSPGSYTAVSSGMASRSHYVWGGIGYTRFLESDGDRRSDLLSYSAVWGYRPPALQKEYPHWDWRGFLELTGERARGMRRDFRDVPQTQAHQIFAGPAALGLYKNYAIEGGIQFPLYRDVGPTFQRERFRFALNLTYYP